MHENFIDTAHEEELFFLLFDGAKKLDTA